MYVPYITGNRAYTLHSSLDFHLLFENFTTYLQLTIRFHIVKIVYFSSLHNFVMFKDICKWDLLHLRGNFKILYIEIGGVSFIGIDVFIHLA